MSIGSNIRKRRRDMDITQERLAELAGCAQSMIAQIERDTRVPSLPLSAAIAVALGCTPNDFLEPTIKAG